MAKVLVNEENLTNIANAIREKNGETTTYKPNEMANAIQSLSSGGSDPELETSFISALDNSLGANCTKLPDNLTSIGKSAFRDRENLALAQLPDSVTSIGNLAFAGCTNLALTKLPNNLTSIAYGAFESCENLALTKLPDGLINLGGDSFYNCTKLALTELPNGLTSIDDNTFQYCPNIVLTKLPDSITSIGDSAFYGCTNLALTRLSNNLTNIKTCAFSDCPNITIKELPVGITIINSYVFEMCTGLTELTLQGNITNIKSGAFSSCTNLATLVLPNVTAVPTLDRTALTNTSIANGTGYIYVPDTLVNSFKSTSNWSTYKDRIRPISFLNNILNLNQQQFPITTDGNITVDYDAESRIFTLNGTVEESHGFNIPITQELLGTYTLSYNPTETDRGFYISLDNKTETMLNGWGANTKTFTLTEQPSQLMFWFDYSDSTPERNVYTDYKINLVLLKEDAE